jgi:hypothetical protein
MDALELVNLFPRSSPENELGSSVRFFAVGNAQGGQDAAHLLPGLNSGFPLLLEAVVHFVLQVGELELPLPSIVPIAKFMHYVEQDADGGRLLGLEHVVQCLLVLHGFQKGTCDHRLSLEWGGKATQKIARSGLQLVVAGNRANAHTGVVVQTEMQ